MPPKITVPIRLKPAAEKKQPSMWILRGQDAEKNLNNWIKDQNQNVVEKLEYAVADDTKGQPIVLIKAKRGTGVPELNIPGAHEMAPHSRTHSNLFMPADTQLNVPKIDPQTIRQMFTENPNDVAWMLPDAEQMRTEQLIPASDWHAQRSPAEFSTEMLDGRHFKPLSEHIGYTAPKGKQHKAWEGGNPFEFLPFTVRDDEGQPPSVPPEAPPPPPVAPTAPPSSRPRPKRPKPPSSPPVAPPEPPPVEQASYVPPAESTSDAMKRKQQIEAQIASAHTAGTPLEELKDLWPKLALANQAAMMPDQASIAWQNALWHNEGDPALAKAWAKSEGVREPFKAVRDLLANPNPSIRDTHKFAAAVKLAAHANPDDLVEMAPAIHRYLEANQSKLGTKAAWLADKAMTSLTGDTLGTVRYRDRLFDRLRDEGMHHQLDTPDFARTIGGEKVTPHHYLTATHSAIREWLNKEMKATNNNPNGAVTKSTPYADMLAAIHMANLGNHATAREIGERARGEAQRLAESEPSADKKNFHFWLSSALNHRLEQALRGDKITEPLPVNLNPGDDYFRRHTSKYVETIPGRRDVNSRGAPGDAAKQIMPLESLSGSELEAGLNRAIRSREWLAANPKSRFKEYASLTDLVNRLPAQSRVEPLKELANQVLRDGRSVDNMDELGVASAAILPELLYHNQNDLAMQIHQQVMGRVTAQDNPNRVAEARQAALTYLPHLTRHLRKAGHGSLAADAVNKLHESLLNGKPLDQAVSTHSGNASHNNEAMAAFINIAKEHLANGNHAQAQPILDAAHAHILKTPGSIGLYHMAGSYLDSLGHLDNKQDATTKAIGLMQNLQPMQSSIGVASKGWASPIHLALADRASKAIAGDSGNVTEGGKRWMDADEYVTRKKINADTNEAVGRAGL